MILGQDPYHGPGQAHGLCFSVKRPVKPPPSLINMYKLLEKDVDGFQRPNHGCLVGWSKQGVLLLNACLTVRQAQANSHKDQVDIQKFFKKFILYPALIAKLGNSLFLRKIHIHQRTNVVGIVTP